MRIRQVITDFLALFTSSIANKLIGFLREILIVSLIGVSPDLAAYIMLRTGVDFLSMLGGPAALQANIVPKFSRLFKEKPNLSYILTYLHTRKIAVGIILISFVLLIGIIFFYSYWDIENIIFIAIVLSITSGVLFNNQMGLMLTQAKGNFKYYSKVEFFNFFIGIVFLYPFIHLLGVLGAALSRFLGIASMFFLSWSRINIKKENIRNNKTKLSKKDFNIYVIVGSNFSLIALLVARWFSGIAGDNADVIHFYYAMLILNVLTTAVGRSISSILLRESAISNIYNSINKFLKLSLLFIIPFTLSLFFLAEDITLILLQYGNYSINDALLTASVLKILIPVFIIHFYTIILIQPLLSSEKFVNKSAKIITFILVLSVFVFIIIFCFNNNLKLVYYFLYSNCIATILTVVYFYLNQNRAMV